jgi:predicted solute-binding protein
VSFDSTGYKLSKTSPFATWGEVEVKNELNKDVAKSLQRNFSKSLFSTTTHRQKVHQDKIEYTGYELSRTSPLAIDRKVEEENQLVKERANIGRSKVFKKSPVNFRNFTVILNLLTNLVFHGTCHP